MTNKMKFIYIEKTLDAPKRIKLLGYDFELNGNAVEVVDERIINKLSNMEHVGIIEFSKIKTLKIKKDKAPVKKKPFKDAIKELTENATREHILNVVNTKTADYLIEYINSFAITVSKEDKAAIKKPELTKTTLQKYVMKSLQERMKEVKEEKKAPVDEVAELVNSKTYNELMAFVKAKEIKTADTKKDTLIKAITEYLKENGTN